MPETDIERQKRKVHRLAVELLEETRTLQTLAARGAQDELTAQRIYSSEAAIQAAADDIWFRNTPSLHLSPWVPGEERVFRVWADGRCIGGMMRENLRTWEACFLDKDDLPFFDQCMVELTKEEELNEDLAMKAVWREYVRYWRDQGRGRL